MAAQTKEQRAAQQEWAVKVQTLENKLEDVKAVCNQYFEGLITADECVDAICLRIFYDIKANILGEPQCPQQ